MVETARCKLKLMEPAVVNVTVYSGRQRENLQAIPLMLLASRVDSHIHNSRFHQLEFTPRGFHHKAFLLHKVSEQTARSASYGCGLFGGGVLARSSLTQKPKSSETLTLLQCFPKAV